MPKNVIIIGGGLAGLRSASELINRGYDVTVLERSPMAGGCTSSWIDERGAEPTRSRKGNQQMGFNFYQNLYYWVWRELMAKAGDKLYLNPPRTWAEIDTSPFSAILPGFYFHDEFGRRTYLTDRPRSLMGKWLKKLPAPLSALQIMWDFDGLPTLRDKLSTLKFHRLALLFGDKVVPPINDDYNYFGFMDKMGMTHKAIKSQRQISYSITNLSDADQAGPKFFHLFFLAYLRDDNILNCRMMNDDCNPALIDPLVSALKHRGARFRFNCHVRDLLIERDRCVGVKIADLNASRPVICANCGLKFPTNANFSFCGICGKTTGLVRPPADERTEVLTADYVISAIQPHQLAEIYRHTENHPLKQYPDFRALGQFKGAELTVSRIYYDHKLTNEYNLTGLDRDHFSFNGVMDISNVMPRFAEASVFDTLSDDGEVLSLYPDDLLKAKLLVDVGKVFPTTKGLTPRQHVLAHIYPPALYHRILPRLSSRFMLEQPGTSVENFFLAGDWMDDFEIGMEAAVKSGIRAVNALLTADGRSIERELVLKPSVAPMVKWLQNNWISRIIKARYEKRYRRELPPRRG